MSVDELSLDIGCGFLDYHQRRGGIGIDLQRGRCDIVADAENLPFRNDVFDKIVLWQILEHLDEPMKCLREALRVGKVGCYYQISFPVEIRGWINDMKRMVFEFPHGFLITLRRLRRFYAYSHVKGVPHKSLIRPSHIAALTDFDLVKVDKIAPRHLWFSGQLGRLLKKILGRELMIGAGKQWHIIARKKAEAYE